MKGSKFVKAFVLGVGLTVLSSTAAFASTDGIEPAMIREVQPVMDKALYEKQALIDRFIFEEHARELEARGITVTHTGFVGEVLEVGIIPYTEENAKYLHEALGTDGVKVVEGMQMTIMTMAGGLDTPVAAPDEGAEVLAYTDDPNALIYATAIVDDDGANTATDSQIYETTAVQDAELYTTTAEPIVRDAEMYTTTAINPVQLSAGAEEAANNAAVPIAAAAAVILLGGAVMGIRRRKAGSR